MEWAVNLINPEWTHLSPHPGSPPLTLWIKQIWEDNSQEQDHLLWSNCICHQWCSWQTVKMTGMQFQLCINAVDIVQCCTCTSRNSLSRQASSDSSLQVRAMLALSFRRKDIQSLLDCKHANQTDDLKKLTFKCDSSGNRIAVTSTVDKHCVVTFFVFLRNSCNNQMD